MLQSVTGSNGLDVSAGSNSSYINLVADTSYLQRRVGGACNDGEAIQSIHADGTIECESMPIYTLNTTKIRMQQTLKSSCPSGTFIQRITPSGNVTCGADSNSGGDVTSIVVGSGLLGGGTDGDVTINIDTSMIQRRASTMACEDGNAIQRLYANGSLACVPIFNGDITSVFAGNGLNGDGSTSGDVTISVDYTNVQKRGAAMSCETGTFIRSIQENGTIVCATDTNAGGDITAVNVGNGMTGSAESGDVSIGIDFDIVQGRVASTCNAGSSIRVINNDGTVECELDNDSGGDLTAITVSGGLTGGGQVGAVHITTNTSYLQKRITQGCVTGSYIREITRMVLSHVSWMLIAVGI